MRLPKRFSQLFAPVLLVFNFLGQIMHLVGQRKEDSHGTR
jgi:hypothetical protein